jgi:hypothetical protein
MNDEERTLEGQRGYKSAGLVRKFFERRKRSSDDSS